MRQAWCRNAALAALLACPALAAASGAALLAGPIALPRDLVSPDEPADRGLRLFLSGADVRTSEDFSLFRADLDGRYVTAGVVKRTAENYFVSLAAGTLLGSRLDPGDGALDLHTGLVVEATATWRVVEGYDEEPFVTATFGCTHLRVSSEDGELYRGTDLSVGVAVGKAFAETWAPYLAVKFFGGPITWHHGEPVRGTDDHMWQAAVGFMAALSSGLDLQVEVAPLGARSVVVTVGDWR
jgi:hypothetical protein